MAGATSLSGGRFDEVYCCVQCITHIWTNKLLELRVVGLSSQSKWCYWLRTISNFSVNFTAPDKLVINEDGTLIFDSVWIVSEDSKKSGEDYCKFTPNTKILRLELVMDLHLFCLYLSIIPVYGWLMGDASRYSKHQNSKQFIINEDWN